MSILNILRGLPCRSESLRLKGEAFTLASISYLAILVKYILAKKKKKKKKFTNEPFIFVDGDLAESIKRSAYDRLGDLVP